MMLVLVKSNDVRSGTKARLVTSGRGRHGSQWVKEVLKKVLPVPREHEGNVENISREFSLMSGVFYHSVIHGLGFFIRIMI